MRGVGPRPPRLHPRRRRGPDVAPGMERGFVRRAGSGLRVRGRGARAGARRPGARCLRRARREDGVRRVPDRRGRPGRRRGSSGRNARRWSGACSSASGCARSPHARRHPTRRPWSLRPGARRRAVHGDRLGAPAAGAAVARPSRRALPAGSAPGRDRGRGRRPPPPRAGASCTRCARSLARRPTRRATRSSGTAPTSNRSTTPGPAGADPATRHRLWPHRHGTDGMFVAAFERSG